MKITEIPGGRWALVVGSSGLAVYGLTRRSPLAAALAVVGGGLAYRAATEDSGAGYEINAKKSLTVNRPIEEVYKFWRNLENLPRFMKHLQSVSVTGDTTSHWVATAPVGTTVSWDAEITEDQPPRLIAWHSVGSTAVPNSGVVRFKAAPAMRGTEVTVMLHYSPPAGPAGAAVAKLFGEEPAQQIDDDLRRFKNLMEAGETPTTEGQSSGREKVEQDGEVTEPSERGGDLREGDATGDSVEQASDESFPASDPPASW